MMGVVGLIKLAKHLNHGCQKSPCILDQIWTMEFLAGWIQPGEWSSSSLGSDPGTWHGGSSGSSTVLKAPIAGPMPKLHLPPCAPCWNSSSTSRIRHQAHSGGGGSLSMKLQWGCSSGNRPKSRRMIRAISALAHPSTTDHQCPLGPKGPWFYNSPLL